MLKHRSCERSLHAGGRQSVPAASAEQPTQPKLGREAPNHLVVASPDLQATMRHLPLACTVSLPFSNLNVGFSRMNVQTCGGERSVPRVVCLSRCSLTSSRWLYVLRCALTVDLTLTSFCSVCDADLSN